MAEEIAKRWASLPVVYEAMLLTKDNAAEVAEWINGFVSTPGVGWGDEVMVDTPGGILEIRPGNVVYRNGKTIGFMRLDDWLLRHEPTV